MEAARAADTRAHPATQFRLTSTVVCDPWRGRRQANTYEWPPAAALSVLDTLGLRWHHLAVPFQLIYRSRVARKVRLTDAEAIAASAAENNAKASISGLLLYTPTYFVQVLEGERDAVEATFARITKDSRHEEVVTLAKTEVAERQFGDWGMRAVTPSRELNAAVIGQLNGEDARELLLKSR